MAVGRDSAQLQRAIAFDGVEENAVEVIAGFFRRNRKLGAVDEALQRLRLDAEGG